MARTVAYFTDSAGFGGAEQSLLNLLGGLDRRRWRPVLFHHSEPRIEPLVREARRLDVATSCVPAMPEGRRGALRVPSFVRRLRALRPAVFHAHLTWPLACKYGLFAAALARIPAIVATVHLFVDLPYPRSVRLKQRVFAAGIHRHVAVSQAVATRLGQTFAIPARKIGVVPNGIPLTPYDREICPDLRAALNGGMRRPIVLSVARLDRQKGQRYLLQAAVCVPEASFVLVGDGPDRAALEAEAHDLKLDGRIVFLGQRGDVPDLLAACDAFVLPSLWEGLPLSVLEAMAAARPVIATDVGGTREAIVHGETGLLVPPADPIALAHAIRAVLFDSQLADRLAVAGRSRVHAEFAVDTMVRRVTDIYAELLGGRQTSNGGR